jgi:hypothetical protein
VASGTTADADCRIELSKPATIADEDGEALATGVRAHDLQAGVRYRLLDVQEAMP